MDALQLLCAVADKIHNALVEKKELKKEQKKDQKSEEKPPRPWEAVMNFN